MTIVEYVIKVKDSNASKSIAKLTKQMRNLNKAVDKTSISLNELFTKVKTIGTNQAVKGFADIGRGVREMDRQVVKSTNSMLSFQNVLLATAGIAVANIGRNIVNTTVEFEKYNAILSSVLGSNSKAAETMQFLQTTAADTSSGINEVVRAFTRLSSSNIFLDENQLRQISDFSLATNPNRNVSDFAEAILDAQVGEFERLKEFNVRANARSQDTVAFTFKNVTTEVAKSSEAIGQYLINLGKLPGIAGINEAVLKTLGGQMAKLSDNITFLFKDIGEQLLPVFIAVNKALDASITGIRRFGKFLDDIGLGMDGFIIALTAGTIAALTYTGAASAAAAVTAALASPILLVAGAVAGLVAGFTILWRRSETLRGVLFGLAAIAEVMADSMSSTISNVALASKEIRELGKTKQELSAFETTLLFFEKVGAGIVQIFKNIGNAIAEGVKFIILVGQTFADQLSPITNFIAELTTLDTLLSSIADTFKAGFRRGLVNFLTGNSQGQTPEVPQVPGPTSTPSTATPSTTSSTARPSTISSASPRIFNINIENLVREFSVDIANNINAGAEEVKQKIQQALLEAVADVELSRTF